MSGVVVDVVMADLDRLHDRVASRFARAEPRARVREYVSGLVAGLERKNGRTLAERAGETAPDGMQRLLRWADWDIDGVRDDVRDHVVEHLGSRDGVLILDDTGFIKKGVRSAGVQRQYSGTAGRVENCQIGTFLAYACDRGHALIDRELYLPESWTADRDRCRAAGVPDEVEFATKPRQGMAMLERAIAAGVPFGWVTADEAYGQVKYLRVWLEDHDAAHVVSTKCNDTLITVDAGQRPAQDMIAELPKRAWRRLSVGAGAHGPRIYDWARVPIWILWRTGRGHWLLARRSVTDPSEIAYYVCYGPRRSTLVDLAWVAGSRWHIEECFQQAKNEAGLDQYQVRSFRAWYGTSRCRCSHWPGSPGRKPSSQRGNQRPRPGHDQLHATGDPPPARGVGPATRRTRRARLVLVGLAPTTPVPGQSQSPPTARLPPITAVAILDVLIGDVG